jgi:alpha-beta hydrolase superfamily lysophospholipase
MADAPSISVQKHSKFRRVARKFAIGTSFTAAAYLALAVTLVYWPTASYPPPDAQSLQASNAPTDLSSTLVRERSFEVRDGARIAARVHGADGLPTMLVIHGVAAQAKDMDAVAAQLVQKAKVRVVAIDLRGHGKSSGEPWQLRHVGQFDDDISDIISQLKAQAPTAPIILSGFSMGGGIAIRYSLAQNAAPVDGFLLLTPLLGSDSPSMTKDEKDQPKATSPTAVEPPVIFRTQRMIGVIMLHSIGITAFDQLPIMLFNHDDRPSYGFAAIASMQPNAPKDFRVALKAIAKPLLLIAGTSDEYFNAAAFPKIITDNSTGEAALIDGATHEGLLTDPRAIDKVVSWLIANKLASTN